MLTCSSIKHKSLAEPGRNNIEIPLLYKDERVGVTKHYLTLFKQWFIPHDFRKETTRSKILRINLNSGSIKIRVHQSGKAVVISLSFLYLFIYVFIIERQIKSSLKEIKGTDIFSA